MSSQVIVRLQEIKLELDKSINDRKTWWQINCKAETENREPTQKGGVYPSPYNNPETGDLEWRWHILVRKQDLDAQVEHLTKLVKEIDKKIAFLQMHDDDRSESVKQGLLIDIIVKAHDMGVLVASKNEIDYLYSENYPGRALAEDLVLQMFEEVNKLSAR